MENEEERKSAKETEGEYAKIKNQKIIIIIIIIEFVANCAGNFINAEIKQKQKGQEAKKTWSVEREEREARNDNNRKDEGGEIFFNKYTSIYVDI